MYWITAAVASMILLLSGQVHGHGYLMEPKSRNYYAATDGVWWCPGNCDNIPKKEDTPHGMNGFSECGIKQGDASVNYNFPKNYNGGPLAWKTQSVYQPAATITVKFAITAFHKGHFEMYACPRSQSPTQACFNKYPLQFVSDKRYGAVKDNNYPGRAYATPTPTTENGVMVFEFTMKLPSGVSGDALIQWIYVTANTCNSPGYDRYPFPWAGAYNPGLAVCSTPSQGERFWNCAEVNIGGSPTSPVPPPVQAPVPKPVASPVKAPVVAPVQAPVSGGTCCAGGVTGNKAANGCKGYAACVNGVNFGFVPCSSGTLFNEAIGVCDWQANVKCATSCTARRLRGNGEQGMNKGEETPEEYTE